MVARVLAIALLGCWSSSVTPPPPDEPRAEPAKVAAKPSVDPFDRSTPRAALRSFLRAVEHERFDIIVQFIPAKYRDKLDEATVRKQFESEETRETLEHLRDAVDNPIEETGDRAVMQYDRGEITFVREDGTWRIEDVD